MAKAHAGTRDAKNASECIHPHAGTACGPRANLPAGRMCYACTVRPHRTAPLATSWANPGDLGGRTSLAHLRRDDINQIIERLAIERKEPL